MQIFKLEKGNYQAFPYHLVDPSPWPILVSFSLLSLMLGAAMYLHGFSYGGYFLTLGFTLTTFGTILWFRDIITEATFLGHHTMEVQKGLSIGIVLFIISEVFAFLSVFWGFFHSSLSASVEIGGSWPPLGITPLDPFAIPLLNTILLLSSGAFVTYGHHALIEGNRKGAILGTFLTIIFAIVFTALQYYEYSEAGFTMSDSVYGTVFYASTGLHGYYNFAPTKINYNKFDKVEKNHRLFFKLNSTLSSNTSPAMENGGRNKPLILYIKNNKKICLDKKFLEWLAGFTDAEGNFNISFRNFKNNSYNSLLLTYQIGLHIKDLKLLEFIQENLKSGSISISGDRCNFFINDQFSLINVVLPIFNSVKLNSSKYFQYKIFEKAVFLIKNKKHLTPEGKLKMIEYFNELKNFPLSFDASTLGNKNTIKITDSWLGGFVDGEACFSLTRQSRNFTLRFKFENHIKELNLFNKIKEYIDLLSIQNQTSTHLGLEGSRLNNEKNIQITSPRKNRKNSNSMVVLEYNKIHLLKNVIIPLFSKPDLLKSKKLKDFKDWCLIANIIFYGYHRIPEGIDLINKIIIQLNNNRNIEENNNEVEFKEKIKNLFLIDSPYEIKNGIRFYRDTDKFVSENLKILTIDNLNNKLIFSSLSDCSRTLQINRTKIKKCLLTGEKHNNYKFIFYSAS